VRTLSTLTRSAALALLCLCTLLGCTLQTESADDMRDPNDIYNNPRDLSRWGQSKPLGPNWSNGANGNVGAGKVVTFLESADLPYPEVLTVNLGVEYTTPFTDVNGFRWRLNVGVGGARKTWILDALPMQQVSLPAHSVEVSLFAEPFFVGDTFVDPSVTVQASAFIARGNTSTSAAQYSQGLNLAAVGDPNASRLLPYPPGAVGFRFLSTVPAVPVVGNGSLFDSDVEVRFVTAGGAGTLAVYLGSDFEALSKTDGYVPLPGGVDALIISNTSVGQARSGVIIWELDL
jgi:hypothetical protein